MTPRRESSLEQSGESYHVVTFHVDENGSPSARTEGFDSKAQAAVRYAQSASWAQENLEGVRRRAVWLYEISPLDGRRVEVESWISDYTVSA